MPDANDVVLVRHLTPKNLLSFGPDFAGIELGALNMFIGPNASGKSNIIESVNLMRAAPKEYREVTRRGGGVAEWIWKGGENTAASVEWLVSNPMGTQPLKHTLCFRTAGHHFVLEDERIEDERAYDGHADVYFYYRFQHGRPALNVKAKQRRDLSLDEIEADRSILAQRRDPDSYPELAWLAESYEKIRIYREWAFGRNAVFREPQHADLRNDYLAEDFSNLGMFLSKLRKVPKIKSTILDNLCNLYEGLTDFEVIVEGGSVQVFFSEGEFSIPASRLSDGTLRYLCLLAILCDPAPPPLVCIEEPELGLHPDILPGLADLLHAASERTQLLVTTHSDILVDAMTDTPEAVVVCEKHEGQSTLERLSSADLAVWLEKYRLGQLWIDGQLGGKRW